MTGMRALSVPSADRHRGLRFVWAGGGGPVLVGRGREREKGWWFGWAYVRGPQTKVVRTDRVTWRMQRGRNHGVIHFPREQ